MTGLTDLYFVKNLRASRVNLLMNDFAAGLPSPLSFLGLGDLLARRMGLAPWSAGTLPVLHQVYVSEGRTKPEMENKSGFFTPIETTEDLTGTVDLSLLLHLPGCESAITLKECLTGCRIAGGPIQSGEFTVERVTPDGSAFIGLRRGQAMISSNTPERLRITTGDQEGLVSIANTLFPAERPQGFGWIVPAAVGYRLLENPETVPQRLRTRSREIPHVFAEPVLGIAELVSVRNRRLTELSMTGLDALLWRWEARGDFILGHPAYHSQQMNFVQPKEIFTHGQV